MDWSMSLSQKIIHLFSPPRSGKSAQLNLVQTAFGDLTGTREAANREVKRLVCSGVGWFWIQVLALLLTLLGKFLNLSVPPLPLFQMGIIVLGLQGYWCIQSLCMNWWSSGRLSTAETGNRVEHGGCKLEPYGLVWALPLSTCVPSGRLLNSSAQFLHLFRYANDDNLPHGIWWE